jgi:hypothetical protein
MTSAVQPRKAVQIMAEHQEKKFIENDHKQPWEDLPVSYLLNRLKQEVWELDEAVRDYESLGCDVGIFAEKVVKECADVSNCSTMVASHFDARMRALSRGREV